MLTEKDITNALGGSKVLGKQTKSLLDISDMIEQGFPTKTVYFLQSKMALSDEDYSSMLGVTEKWLDSHRKKIRAHVDSNISNRIYCIARVFTLAIIVLENKNAANKWLCRPQSGLCERVPIELIKNGAGAREVEELLCRIEFGM